MSNRGVSRPWVLLSSILLAACASQQPPPAQTAPAGAPPVSAGAALTSSAAAVKILSAAEARPMELASVSITSVDKLLTNGATLVAKAVPLPIDPSGLRDMLLGQAGMPPEVSANLDLGAPIGVAIVATAAGAGGAATGAGSGNGLVLAISARGPAEAGRVVAALGRQVEKRGPLVLIESPSGRGWLFVEGAVIVYSDDIQALARGARLAQEARHAVPEDVTAFIHPDAIARANGTDVKTALAGVGAQLQAAQAAQPEAVRTNPQAMEGMTEMLNLLGDAEVVEVGLVADPAKGLSLRGRLKARPGSGLEKVARDAHPYELDGTLLAVSPQPALVGASSLGAFSRAQLVRQRDALKASKAKGAAAALAFQEALIAGVGGQVSFAARLTKEAPLFAAELAYTLKDEAAATAVGSAMVKLDKDALRALADAQGGAEMFSWTAKVETIAKVKAVHFVLQPKKELTLDAEIQKKIFGKGLEAYFAVVGTRLVTTIGREAKSDLAKLVKAKPVAPTGALADTLAATKGRDTFFHLDLAPMFSLVGTLLKDKKAQAIAGATTAPLPLIGAGGGDPSGKASFELTVPPATFVNAKPVVQAGMAASMAGGAGGAEPELAAPPKKKGAKKKEK
jgi:hypothetical protein